MSVDLKKVEQEAPELVSMTKSAGVTLQKRNLAEHTARVALVLDISGSMGGLYRSGAVQKLAERILALGLHFDDNGAIDVFAFDNRAHEFGEMDLGNFRNFIKKVESKVGGGTSYAPIMKKIREHYAGGAKKGLFRKRSSGGPVEPAYVMFVTDGEPFDPREAERELQEASKEGIFWQFVAVGAERIAFLERLDDLGGREIDNAAFFGVRDPAAVPEGELYDKLMVEYPGWLPQARQRGYIV